MLNCFFWYPVVWGIVLFLYAFKISTFNRPLNISLIIFIIFTNITSIILGILFKDEFKQHEQFEFKDKKKIKYIKYLILGFIMEYVYSRNVPFISIVILKKSYYGEFVGIPIFHVLLVAFSLYLAILYYNNILYNKKYKKSYIIPYICIIVLFFLTYYRSMIIITLLISILLTINKYIDQRKLSIKHIMLSFFIVLLFCYLYGGVGNLRDGYAWNDNSYIERLGMFEYYPKYIPKQYMWTYSYLTTPLANLNFNIEKNNYNFDFYGILSEFMPDTISKRILPKISTNDKFIIIRTYFNAVTGWCSIYNNGGIIGMYILFFYIVILTIVGLKFARFRKNNYKRKTFYAVLCVVYIFMFFYNTLTYVGISVLFWIVFVSLFPKIKLTK